MKLLKFTAIWCPSCIYVDNELNKIKDEINIEVISYDYDNDKEMVEKWGIDNILPVLILVDNNENEIKRLIGERTKNQLLEVINSAR